MTDLYEANNQKLNQLNQLSSNPEDMASQDQLVNCWVSGTFNILIVLIFMYLLFSSRHL